MLNSVETPQVVQFKATNSNNRQTRNYNQMPMPIGKDTYVKQKEDNKEKWYKAGVIAGVVLAASFGIQAILSGLTHGATKRMLKAQEQYFLKAAKDVGKNADEAITLTDDAVKSLWRNIEKEKSVDELILPKKLKDLATTIENSIKNPDRLRAMNSDPIFSVLLYGPPGTGKTAFSMGIAKKFKGSEFAYLDVGTMKDMWHGGSEKKINALIDNICARADVLLKEYHTELGKVIGEDVVKRGNKKEIAKAIMEAKKAGKTIPEQKRIFVLADEIDSIMMVDNSHGAKLSNDMLNEFKKGFTDKLGRHENITIFGCTNLKIDPKAAMTVDGKMLDKAMLDRFEAKELVDLPNKEQLLGTFKKHFAGIEEDIVSKDITNVKNGSVIDKLCEFMASTNRISFREFNSILKGAPRTIANETRPLEARDLVNYFREHLSSYNIPPEEFNRVAQSLGVPKV